MKLIEALSKQPTNFDKNKAITFPCSRFPVVPELTGNVIDKLVISSIPCFQTQKFVPGSHGNQSRKSTFRGQCDVLKAAENLNSYNFKTRSRFPRSRLLRRVSVLGTTLVEIEIKKLILGLYQKLLFSSGGN